MAEALRIVGESQDERAQDAPRNPIDINRVRAGLRLTAAISALVNNGPRPEATASTHPPPSSDSPVLRLLRNPES